MQSNDLSEKMREQFDCIKRMWNNPKATDEEALEWIIAHALALSARLRHYL